MVGDWLERALRQLSFKEQLALLGTVFSAGAAVAWWFFQQYWTRRAARKALRVRVKCVPVAKKAVQRELVKLGLKELMTERSVVAELSITNNSHETAQRLEGQFLVKDAVFVTPGWYDAPDGFEHVWKVIQGQERLVVIELLYLNPQQTFTAKFLLDKMPPTKPCLVMLVPGYTLEVAQ